MNRDFKIGQEVVCTLWSRWVETLTGNPEVDGPANGQTCIVRDFDEQGDLFLEGYPAGSYLKDCFMSLEDYQEYINKTVISKNNDEGLTFTKTDIKEPVKEKS